MHLGLGFEFVGAFAHGVEGGPELVGLLFDAGEGLGAVFLFLGALGAELGGIHAALGLGEPGPSGFEAFRGGFDCGIELVVVGFGFDGLGLLAFDLGDHFFQFGEEVGEAGLVAGLVVGAGGVELGLEAFGGGDAQGVGLPDGFGFALFLVPGALGIHHLAGELGQHRVEFADFGFGSAFRVEGDDEVEEAGLHVAGFFHEILLEKLQHGWLLVGWFMLAGGGRRTAGTARPRRSRRR